MLRASTAQRSISGIQRRITTAETTFTRAFNQMKLENASIEYELEEVRNDILRHLDTMSNELNSYTFE